MAYRLFNAKATPIEKQQLYYWTHSWGDKVVHNFPKGISPKVDVIARMWPELAYCEPAVQY